LSFEIVILAGGLSERMGRDKARVRLGRRTMLGTVRKAAVSAGLPVRVIRRDCVPRCGPLGGIYTGLKTARADVVLFLACDMPFVSVELVQWIVEKCAHSSKDVFIRSEDGVGFPLAMQATQSETVAAQIEKERAFTAAPGESCRRQSAPPSARMVGAVAQHKYASRFATSLLVKIARLN
jgi:molybdopterin-guanine dinucleotide biosynthesis protein A